MRIWNTLLSALTLLMFWGASASAQFLGVNVDGAIGYSGASSVSGGSVGVTHPIPLIPNIGATAIYFNKRDTGAAFGENEQVTLSTRVAMSTLNFFYHLPVPIISVTGGFGVGTLNANTKIIRHVDEVSYGTVDTVDQVTAVSEVFVRVGYSFFPLLDFHLGYHALQAPVLDVADGADVEIEGITHEKDFSGGLTTFGVQLGF